jgi:uncharacterized protein
MSESLEAMPYSALPERAIKLMIWRAWIRTGVFSLLSTAAATALFFTWDDARTLQFWALIGALYVPTIYNAIAALVMPRLRWRHAKWRVTPTQIEWAFGVWFRSESTIPRSRVQHIEVSQGPLQRSLKLASLNIYTAGERMNSVTISGMDATQARDVRTLLLERVTGHVV